MIDRVSGILCEKEEGFAVIEVGGVGLRVRMTKRAIARLAKKGEQIQCFTHLHVREDNVELYGFETKEERLMFILLNNVSNVGPKSALAILDIAELSKLTAAIEKGRPDLLARASGIGKKTAERIIVELRGKVQGAAAPSVIETMEKDIDIVEALSNLGYRKGEIREALAKIDDKITRTEDRLKETLRVLGGNANAS